MKNPLFFISKHVIPHFNGIIAHALKERGLSENKIATLLGVTQPAVNMYLKKPREEYASKLREVGLTEEEIERSVMRLTSAVQEGYQGLEELARFFLELLGSGKLCRYHRSMAELPLDCDICMRLFGYGGKEEREGLLEEVRIALKLLERNDKFTNLLPEVRSNLVARLEKAVTEDDVVGIPGRIVEIKGRARALRPPEFGASRHMARVLLEVSKYCCKVKSAINLKYDDKIDRCIKRLGWKCISISIREEDIKEKDPVISSIRRSLMEHKCKVFIDAICCSAFYGLEASLYVFAENPIQLAEKVLTLADEYVKHAS